MRHRTELNLMHQEAPAAVSAINIIERLFIELVEYPQCLTVRQEEAHAAIKIIVSTTCLSDHKRLVGRKGQSYYAMQTLVEAIGTKTGQRLLLPRYQDPVGDRADLARAERRPDRCQRLEGLLYDLLCYLPIVFYKTSWDWDSANYEASVTIQCTAKLNPDLLAAFNVIMTAIGRRWRCYMTFLFTALKNEAAISK